MTRRFPGLADPEVLVGDGRVLVDGFPVRNPASLVRRAASISIAEPRPLAGERKLRAALDIFAVDVNGRVAVDVGASTGGFTRALLEAGARRVYAVDAGYGQLLGSLRQDARVVNLERTNLGELSRALVPEPIDLLTVDVSYVPLARAIPQLEHLAFSRNADLLALVKPQFELALAAPPMSRDVLEAALRHAVDGIEATEWAVVATALSPVRGGHGAIESFVRARRRYAA